MESNILSISYGINDGNLNSTARTAKDFALTNGIMMEELGEHPYYTLLPFCLVPSKFPKKWFDLACDLQCHLNHVLFQVSHSMKFLRDCLSSTIEADDFTKNIFKIYETVENEKDDKQLSFGLIRSDYLLNCDSSGSITGIKQVESNTISASFGGIAPKIKDCHEYILGRLGYNFEESNLPVNKSVDELAKGLIAAWDAYGNSRAIILFVVEKETKNICDQMELQWAIAKLRRDVIIRRHTFKEIGSFGSLKEKALYLDDVLEVAVVYYRVGYVPQQYTEPEDWDTRLLMERSKAIKCPSAGLHLAGTKRVQLQLSQPGVLEQFVDHDIAEKLRQVFVKQYSLDLNEEGDRALSLGIENPENFVLKPEREGGGNNVYGTDIKVFLERIKTSEERNAYILMERISPPCNPNCILMKDNTPTIGNVIGELGTFGVILGDKNNIMLNNFAGHLLRSKHSDSNETGVAAGFGALDSPYLE